MLWCGVNRKERFSRGQGTWVLPSHKPKLICLTQLGAQAVIFSPCCFTVLFMYTLACSHCNRTKLRWWVNALTGILTIRAWSSWDRFTFIAHQLNYIYEMTRQKVWIYRCISFKRGASGLRGDKQSRMQTYLSCDSGYRAFVHGWWLS